MLPLECFVQSSCLLLPVERSFTSHFLLIDHFLPGVPEIKCLDTNL
jgi:hypothetical protein